MYKVVLTFKSLDESLWSHIQMKDVQMYFVMALFVLHYLKIAM